MKARRYEDGLEEGDELPPFPASWHGTEPVDWMEHAVAPWYVRAWSRMTWWKG